MAHVAYSSCTAPETSRVWRTIAQLTALQLAGGEGHLWSEPHVLTVQTPILISSVNFLLTQVAQEILLSLTF